MRGHGPLSRDESLAVLSLSVGLSLDLSLTRPGERVKSNTRAAGEAATALREQSRVASGTQRERTQDVCPCQRAVRLYRRSALLVAFRGPDAALMPAPLALDLGFTDSRTDGGPCSAPTIHSVHTEMGHHVSDTISLDQIRPWNRARSKGEIMTLHDQISDRAKEIRTDGYAMSIGEVISLYNDGDMDIHPEFQRIFRWKESQKSRLIESIMLGIPVPPIFVSQRQDGVWDVIDGVQRLSTILQFTGHYKDESGDRLGPLVLSAGEYLTSLDGCTYAASEDDNSFDEVLRRDFKRAKLDFRIITKESDQNAKYDLFQRLNSGSILSPQETRNCLLIMLNRGMFEKVSELSRSTSFNNTLTLSERKEDEAYSQELVLRFYAQATYEGDGRELPEEYGEYLTDWMRRRAESRIPLDDNLFMQTFALLEAALGEDSFRRFNGSRHLGAFSIAAFEFIASGVARHIGTWNSRPPADLRARVESMWTEAGFTDNSGTGFSSRRRVPKLVLASRDFFS